MKVNNLMRIFLSLCLLTAFSSMVIADQQGDLPITAKDARAFYQQLRMVEGGLCQDLPDDKGTPETLDSYGRVWCVGPSGVTDDLRGCVVHFVDANWNMLREEVLEPGKTSQPAPYNTAYWQRFNCHEVDYTCSLFESKGCGKSGSYAKCEDTEMLRVRTCSANAPKSVETERCIPWNECYEGIPPKCDFDIGEWGRCIGGRQERTITETDCRTWKDTQDCKEECSNPAGKEGDTYCASSGSEYICASSGTWQYVGVCSGGSGSGGSGSGIDWSETVAKELVSTGMTAYYDPTSKYVIGKVKIKNNGPDMVDTHLIEMQVLKTGVAPFAFITSQKTCDAKHPENVHKLFMLKSGEEAEIELRVSDEYLKSGKYDVFFLTRHKCYVDLTEEESANHNEFQLVPPFPSYKKVGTVEVPGISSWWGSSDDSSSMSIAWIIFAVLLVIAGIVLSAIGIFPVGIPMFIVGALVIVWQAFL